MTYLSSYLSWSARMVVLAGACALAGCGGGAGGPTPVVPAQGQFVWTVDGLTVTASDTFIVDGHKAAGYSFSTNVTETLLSISGTTEQLFDCSVMTVVTNASTLPAPGRYPVDLAGPGTFGVFCNDPTSTLPDNVLDTDEGEVVITKAEPGDLEGTFWVSGPIDAAVGGFNVGCMKPDCTSPP